MYQADRPFTAAEVAEIKPLLTRFADEWVSHSRQLRAYADLWHDRFVVLVVDETQAGASGCSIDASVRFLQQVQQHFGRDLFDRMRFSYWEGGEIATLPREEFATAYAAGRITDQTQVFDTLVKTKKELDVAFEKPLSDSWHARMV